MSTFKIDWQDGGREPKCQPNPDFPKGRDIDCSLGAKATCTAELPYPAKRCGLYIVECKACGNNAVITTAGRLDDPRTVKFACHRPEVVQ